MTLQFAPLLALLALLTSPLAAQPVGEIVEINPDFSNHSNANGASGGRVNGLAVHPNNPNVLYAASEWGGLFKTIDGGDTWFRLDGHLPVATWDVEARPGQASTVIATSFYDGKAPSISQSGINRSTDGGTNWSRTLPPAGFCANQAIEDELSAFGIAFDPDNSSNVYVGTSCGLAISNNSGATWSHDSPIGGDTRIWDVLVSSDGATVDTCGDAGHWRLNVGAGTWQQGTGILSGRCSLAASPYDDDNLFATVGASIFETEDGTNWVPTRGNPMFKGRIPFVATVMRSFAPAGRSFDLWFGDESLWSVTCDSAASPSCGTGNTPPWIGPDNLPSRGAHGDTGDLVFDPLATNDACPIALSSDGGVYSNTLANPPNCHFPTWKQPTVTPHALWPMGMSGAHRSGSSDEDLYVANMDNGMFGTLDAGSPTPSWTNATPNRSVDASADDFNGGSIVFSKCCAAGRRTRFFKKGAGFSGPGTGELPNYPPGVSPENTYLDSIARWGDNEYAMVTHDFGHGFPPDGGLYSTADIDASPIVWRSLHLGATGTPPPTADICGVKAAVDGSGAPTFYVQTGGCNADTLSDQLFKYTGGSPPGGPGGTWTEITLPLGGVGLFDVQQNDPNHLIAAEFTTNPTNNARFHRSTNGGSSWTQLVSLRSAMVDGGNFPIFNSRGPTDFTSFNGYRQPSLVAIDPNDPRIMVAGARDAGVFLSTDSGATWTRVTDPLNSHTSGVPHIPRPRFAYFDSEPGQKSIYIGSQGRGMWRLELESNCPANVSVVNETITGAQTFSAANVLTVGPNVVVQSGASATFEAGDRIELGDGVSVFGDMTVKIGTGFCPPSGPVQVTPPEWRGAAGKR